MATQKKSQNSLDNLMMAYTDLSSNSKGGSSFKGPAMKDVKVQKAEGPSFKPSQKARDWSSLEQSLESAFSLQQQQQQQHHQPQVLPFQPQFPTIGKQETYALKNPGCAISRKKIFLLRKSE